MNSIQVYIFSVYETLVHSILRQKTTGIKIFRNSDFTLNIVTITLFQFCTFPSCTYRFEANPGEVVRIRVWGVRSGGRLCRSVHSAHSPWFRCAGDHTAAVRIFDRPWKNSGPGVPRDCLCR